MASPNMGLTIPVPTVTEGPQYAENISDNFNIIDSHNHTSGQGSLIPLDALIVAQNLNMNSYAVTNVKHTSLIDQIVAPSINGSVYMTGNDLYWKDGTGAHNVQITNGGSLAGTPGSISGLVSPASAAYVPIPGTFVFQSNVNVGANLDCRNLTLRNNVVSSFGYEVLAPALASNTSVTMPLRPASTKIVSMAATGAITANIDADNTTLEIVGNNLQIKDNGVTTSKILDGSVTNAKLGALGQQISASSGAFNTTSIVPVGVTNLTVNITTTGRPIMILLIPDGTGAPGSWIGITRTVAGTLATARFYIEITGVPAQSINQKMELEGASGNLTLRNLPGCLNYVHVVGAGNYSISIGAAAGLNCSLEVVNCKLVAYEL